MIFCDIVKSLRFEFSLGEMLWFGKVKSMSFHVWHGPYCYNYCRDNGQIKEEAEFPLTKEGTDEIFHWLEEMYTVMEKESRNKN